MTALQERTSEKIIRDIIHETPLPPYVTRTMFRFENDWTGDPAVFVYVIVKDEMGESSKLKDAVLEINELLYPALEKVNQERIPYVRFRTKSEQQDIEKRGLSDIS